MDMVTLHFWEQKGCGHCIVGARALEDWAKENVGKALIIRHRMDLMDYQVQGWAPDGSPGYAVLINGTLLGTHVGALTKPQLEKFIVKASKAEALDDDEDRRDDKDDSDE